MDPPTTSSGNNIITPQIPFFSLDFSLQELVEEELNFHQVIDMISGEAQDPNNNNNIVGLNNANFVSHTISSSILAPNDHQNNTNNQFCAIASEDVFPNFNSPTMSCTDSTIFSPFSGFEEADDMIERGGGGEGEEDDNNYGEAEHSSATNTTTTTTTTTTKKAKVDRSRTLISERRRRGRMKEKLYALRALVPNITKMDKASIVGDAVLYVQDLQTKAKRLKSEVEGLQSSLKAAERRHNNTPNKTPSNHFLPVCKSILQMDVLQIEEREFYVKVVSNKGRGVATSLYKALESFTSFVIQNSNLTTVCERFVLTFTLNVGKCRDDMNLPNLKLWMTGAFLSQGFECQGF